MKQKFSVSLTLALILAMLVTAVAMADDYSIDNDIYTNGKQATVYISVLPGAPINTSANILVEFKGSKHLKAGTSVSFAVDSGQTNLPQGYSVISETKTVPTPWDSTDDYFVVVSNITFTAPLLPGPYLYTVKWNDTSQTCVTTSGDCLTGGGNAFTINLTVEAPDNTPPTASPTQSPLANGNGWNNTDVTVDWNWTDEAGGSGIDTTNCTMSNTTSGEGELTLNATCKDLAGNEGSASYTVKVDKTAPTLVPSISPNPVVLNGTATASANATDATSGVVSSNCDSVDTSSVGSHTVNCSATDYAGNVGYGSVKYSVVYNFAGFFSPVDNLPALNIAKAGQAIPLKWRLTDANGNPVLNLASVKVNAMSLSCNLGITTDQIEEYAAGASGLQNLGDGYYQFNWKTPTTYANSCKTMNLDLGDGLPHTAQFQFKK